MSLNVSDLSKVATLRSGGTPDRAKKEFYTGNNPWVTGSDISADRKIEPRFYISDQAIASSSTQWANSGDLLLVTRTSVGKVAIVDKPVCFSQDITSVSPDASSVDNKYLFHYLLFMSGYFQNRSRGATIKGVPRQVVDELTVPLPTITRQQKIARALDQVDALRAKRHAAIARLDELAQSLFLDMFGDPVSNPMGWPVRTIGDLIDSASYGTSQKAGYTGDLPVLRMNNLTALGHLDLHDLKFLEYSTVSDKHKVCHGDILFNRTNSAELVGKTAVYRNHEPVAYAGYLIRMRANSKNHPEYISAFLNSTYAKRVLRSMCKSIVGMANINARELQKIKIAEPPIQIQQEFASRLSRAQSTKTTHQTHLAKLDELFASLQYRAFRGELFDSPN